VIISPVPEPEVFERLRADLSEQGITLHRGSRSSGAFDDKGRYYATTADGTVEERNIDLERLARDRGVLEPYETVACS
jgi:hypothetical protein